MVVTVGTTYGVASDNKVVAMITFGFECASLFFRVASLNNFVLVPVPMNQPWRIYVYEYVYVYVYVYIYVYIYMD